MRKVVRNIIVFALVFLMIFTYGCSSVREDDKPNESEVRGTHIFNVGTTDKKIIENGVTEYRIVIPKDAGSYVKDAANEIKNILSFATDATFGVMTDEGLDYSENSKYISLGNTSIFRGAGIEIDGELLEGDGFRIVTKGSNIVINGVSDRAVYYGAYELLKQLIHYEYFGINCEVYDKNVRDLDLPDFDITDVADFLYRICGTAPIRGDVAARNKFRMYMDNETLLTVNGSGCHNSTVPEMLDKGYFPYNEYAEKNPEFFSQDFKELCYTAHGKSDSYKKMQEIALERMKTAILEDPSKNIITFTQSDYTASNCKCASCQAAKEKYGSDSAAYLIFVNSVVRELNKWIAENNIRKIYVASFAYNWSFDPPTISPVPDELKLEDNYTIFVAPISADYFVPFTDASNSGFSSTLEKWAEFVNNVMVWEYTTHFTNFLTPFPDFDTMQENLKFFYDKGTMYVLAEGQATTSSQSGFNMLKLYLQGKLMWNVSYDYNELLDGFFKNYYAEANEPMRQLFDELRLWTRHQHDAIGLKGNCLANNKLSEAATWPRELLERWIGLTEQAVKKIERHKTTDPALYNELYKRIVLESIAYRYLLITNYNSYYQANELLSMKLAFRDYCSLTGVTQIYGGSGGAMSLIYSAWGI